MDEGGDKDYNTWSHQLQSATHLLLRTLSAVLALLEQSVIDATALPPGTTSWLFRGDTDKYSS